MVRGFVLGVLASSWLQLGATLLHELTEEAAVLEKLKTDRAAVQTCDAEEIATLVKRGWWTAARELILASHELSDAAKKVQLEKVTRREVTQLKLKADELVLGLSQQDSSKIGLVRCAFQWAQNSTAVFLSIKFSHRWSSPGALKLHDEKVEASPCCFNFSANGDHSGLHKRYALDLKFYSEIDPDRWSWQLASAGRMTAEIGKKTAENWPRLLETKTKPGNMAMWDSMSDRWRDELKAFGKKKKGSANDSESDEADEEEMHEAGARTCTGSRTTPFKASGEVTRLCAEYWPPKMNTKRKGKSATWLVLFHSPQQMKCEERGAECTKIKERWDAIATKVPQVSKAHVGAVDCDAHAELCKKEKVGNLPFVRRYRNGKKKTYYDEWEIDSIMKLVTD
eukprot:TRINITY_DN97986_c0_g1_i1.p1 TRINITY_DN97986_c0_g1~~TRINITY_DN97986_c0_g1_i1.p1  ORF type:complete len:407 (-),score=100.53 TRINITY_DN97986_c0_g1_i1:31-1218(-)